MVAWCKIMLRTSNFGGKTDYLVRVISESCYGESANDIALLFRKMLQTYHTDDSEIGDLEACDLSKRVFAAIPTARKANMVGTHAVYTLDVQNKTYRCTWRKLLAKGSYNHVYYADLTNVTDGNRTTPAVIKVTVQSDKDLRVYLMENVIHAILFQLPETSALVVPIRFPFKIRKSGFPEFTLGTVMDDPGRGHLGDWIEENLKNDEQMFALLTQLSWILYQGQRAVSLEHRDLKADNVMIASSDVSVANVAVPEVDAHFLFPTMGIRCMLIDFGMARLELQGEYIACDCMHNRTSFNRCHDLQNFCCTLVEDYKDELIAHAPRFYQWMSSVCEPLFVKVRTTWPDYDAASSSKRHERLNYVVNREKHHCFMPHHMLKTLGVHWSAWRR